MRAGAKGGNMLIGWSAKEGAAGVLLGRGAFRLAVRQKQNRIYERLIASEPGKPLHRCQWMFATSGIALVPKCCLAASGKNETSKHPTRSFSLSIPEAVQ